MKGSRLLLGMATTALVAGASAQPLYDARSGVLPSDASWGWSYGATGGTATGPTGGKLRLDTMANDGFQAGFGRTLATPLDPTVGYRVRFDLNVASERHTAGDHNADGLADRSGTSFIVLGADGRGVELALWNDEVWAQQQTPLFTHSPSAERAFLNTAVPGTGVSGLRRYELVVRDQGYTLSVDGVPILSGQTKSYAAFTGFPDPYETPNFLFFGDNSTSVAGASDLSYIETSPVPEPATLLALGAGLLALARRRR